MIRRLAPILALISVLAAPANAQLEWDKPDRQKPLPNPSSVRVGRDRALELAKAVLAERSYPLRSATCDETSGVCTITTEPIIFTRGIVAATQFSHFAEHSASDVRHIVRGRVVLRVEVSPTSPTASLVGIYGTFARLSEGAVGSEWTRSPSRGVLEDELLRCLVARADGRECERMPGDDDAEPQEESPTPTGGGSRP